MGRGYEPVPSWLFDAPPNAGASGRPPWTPEPAELADLELLLAGAFKPLTGFLGSLDTAAVVEGGRLADGTPWPAPVLLGVPASLAG